MSGVGFRSGFVAVVGRPNVGKSTLVNAFLGEKLAIVSDKPQTTRNRIRGIVTGEAYQVVFIDTPGIHQARDQINRTMVKRALATFEEVDLILFLVEPSNSIGKGDRAVVAYLEKVDAPAFVLVNKIDKVTQEERERSMRTFREGLPGRDVFAVSALKGEGVEAVLQNVVRHLPEGGPFFPPDQLTDKPARFLCAELVREKVFHFAGEEIPYAVAVEIQSFKEPRDDSSSPIHIDVNLHVERPSQKGILIGKGGQMLKRIGVAARHEMEGLLGRKVVLKLWVKVTKGWRNDPKSLRWLGYR